MGHGRYKISTQIGLLVKPGRYIVVETIWVMYLEIFTFLCRCESLAKKVLFVVFMGLPKI